MYKIKIFCFILALLFCIFLAYLSCTQNKYIYPGMTIPYNELSVPYIKINQSYYKKGTTGRLWIYFGGNRSSPKDSMFIRQNIDDSFFFVGYPGYNGSKIKMNPRNSLMCIREDISKLNYPSDKTNIICYSIGCAIAINWLSIDNQARYDNLILLAPFWSLDKVINENCPLPRWLVRLLLDHNWENKRLQFINEYIKVHIYHGKQDKLISYKHSEQLSRIRNVRLTLTDDDHKTIRKYLQKIIT